MELQSPFFFAVTWVGQEHRVWGLDWSYLTFLGLVGNVVFSTRFLIQWMASEKKGESVIPISFWYWSIFGSVIMCLYFIFKRDPVGILAYLPNSFIYFRNLHLIKRRQIAVGKGA
jgi:lipid-A-disaccharide synthase-like uncharacterized protein